MGETKDVKDAEGKEASYDYMDSIYADNVSEKKQKKWGLKNITKGGYKSHVE
jgi:hypothetical protein